MYGGFAAGLQQRFGAAIATCCIFTTPAASAVIVKGNHKSFSTAPQQKKDDPETFLNGTSSLYAEQMYEMYLQDPSSVHPSWKQYFDNLEHGIGFDVKDYSSPTAVSSSSKKALLVGVSEEPAYNQALNCPGLDLSRYQVFIVVFVPKIW